MQYIYKISGTKAEFINRDGTHGNDASVIHDTSGINKHKNPTATKDDWIWNLQTVFSEQGAVLVEQ